jgi:hypothetical protein
MKKIMAQRKSGYNQTGWRCANTSGKRTWVRRLRFDSRLDVGFCFLVIPIRPSLGPNQPPIKEDLSYFHKAHASQSVMLPTVPHVQPSLRIFALLLPQRNDVVFKNTDRLANLTLYLPLIIHCSGYCSYWRCS